MSKWRSMSWRMIVVLQVLALLAAACGGTGSGAGSGGSEGAGGGEPVEITFRQFDPPAEVEGLTQLVDEWNAEHPEIQVTMESTTNSEVLEGYVREVQAGDGPDIIHLGLVQVLEAGEPGLLADLSGYVESDPPGAGYDDFLATDLGELDGEVYGLPWTVDTFAIGYNPDLLEAAGLDGPPQDWAALHGYAVTIAEETGEPGFCFPAGSGSNSWSWFLFNYYVWSNGGTLVTGGDDATLGTDAAAVADAFAYMKSFFDDGATPQSMLEIDESGDPAVTEALANGQCGMAFMAPANFEAAQDASGTELGSFQIPAGSETQISHLGGRMLALNPNSDHPDEAYQFMTRLMEEDVFAEYYDQFPAQQSLLDAIDFDDSVSGFVDMLPKAQTFAEYVSSPIGVSPMWDTVASQLGAVLTDQTSPDDAAQQVLDAISSELG